MHIRLMEINFHNIILPHKKAKISILWKKLYGM